MNVDRKCDHCKKHYYFDIFHRDFNLAFHTPKKDCVTLGRYSRCNDTEKHGKKETIEEHLKTKTLCRTLKEQEKLRAQNNHTVNVVCFNLQNVLIMPHSMSSQLYYRRKLATYYLIQQMTDDRWRESMITLDADV